MNPESKKSNRNLINLLIDFINVIPVKYPGVVVKTAIGLVVIAFFGLFQLKINTGTYSLIPTNAPEVLRDREIRKKFNCGDKIMVVVETPDPEGIFNYGTLLRLASLSQVLKKINGINPEDVVSLTTIQDRQQTTKFGDFPPAIEFTPFKDSLYTLQKQLYEMKLARGTLVSLDGIYNQGYKKWKPGAAAIIVEMHESSDRNALYEKIKKGVDDLQILGDKVFVMGAPVAESELGIYILKDLAMLIPFSILLMALIFYLYYRNWNVVLLPITEIAGCFIFVFGMIGYTGVPIYLPLTIMPVILVSLGLPDVIHILNRYTFLLAKNPDQKDNPDLVKQTMRGLYRRLIFTSFATIVGFSSFTLSGIQSVRYFGIFTSSGLLFCMIWSLIVIPAQVIITKPVIERKLFVNSRFTGWILSLSYFGLKNKRKLIAGFLLFSILAGYFVSRVYVQDSWESCFSKQSSFSRDNDKTNKLFAGTHTLLISFETDSLNTKMFSGLSPGRTDFLLFPEVLKTESDFENFLKNIYTENQGKMTGLTEQMEGMNFLLNGKQDSARHTGNTPGENERLLQYYKLAMGNKLLTEWIDSTRQRCLLQFYIKNPDYKNVPALIKKIRDYESSQLSPKGIRISFGGDVMQAQTMIGEIVHTQVSSLQLSISAILILLIICFRNFRYGLIGIISPMYAIFLLFAIMGLFSIPLGVATSMFASILVGLGVDFSIHLVECFNDYYNKLHDKEIAIIHALKETGPAFLLDAIVISFSFGLMFFSNVPSNTRLGMAIVTGYLACFGITMILLPVLLTLKKSVNGNSEK